MFLYEKMLIFCWFYQRLSFLLFNFQLFCINNHILSIVTALNLMFSVAFGAILWTQALLLPKPPNLTALQVMSCVVFYVWKIGFTYNKKQNKKKGYCDDCEQISLQKNQSFIINNCFGQKIKKSIKKKNCWVNTQKKVPQYKMTRKWINFHNNSLTIFSAFSQMSQKQIFFVTIVMSNKLKVTGLFLLISALTLTVCHINLRKQRHKH